MARRLALEEALPELTIGLTGIPVAISVDKLIQSGYEFSELEGIVYTVVVFFLYTTVSIILFTSFNLAKNDANDQDNPDSDHVRHAGWEHGLMVRVLLLGVPAAITVLLIVGIGACFDTESSCFSIDNLLEGHSASQTLMYMCFFLIWVLTGTYVLVNKRKTIEETYPILTPYAWNLLIGASTIVVVVFFRSMPR